MSNPASTAKQNPYGYATPEWYEFEARAAGFKTPQAHMQHEYNTRAKCPHCGVPFGFNFGTGDCNCSDV